ncbi:5'-3' exonuclease [Saccharopolyspora erythraea NRRL 2338]|uniref:5'-3' exonuclease n=2 Tax=Saccharopolyspora erythraea TaxID=1836 RepID=A4FC00_SACEN|nr:5'-3' exonuclease [Saccharopolyspora erythraea]EQD84073.1 5'-3' exonuclease [Saccharopolyspora erythraea D]PFG95347.1 5'-3' exonuclease [Saccharopolyspora erythraea NRRL 2338]QRK93477.1 5'-3' exonuclease [Saccharopolyspora erythraea]CAM01575.1 potential 5'-3' exonuclease [Saccharopolyspora erythraea NRRL 2338]
MLIDSAGLWFRSYFALPDSLTAPDGTPVNSVRGFCDMLAKLVTERRPARLVACLDNDWRPQFRVDALPSYKAHRVAEEDPDAEEVPDTLTPQIPVILELLDALGIATAEAEGFEADDVIGALAHRETQDRVEVVTGDRDLFQLVRTEPTPVRVIYVGGGLSKAQNYGPEELAERYGLSPGRAGDDYADMAVLRGDPSDGLPGVAGIGEKTAAKLITQFGSLDALLAAAVEGTGVTPRVRALLADAADYLAAAPAVVRTVNTAPVVVDRVDDALPSKAVDHERVVELQKRWGLGASVDRLLAAVTL